MPWEAQNGKKKKKKKKKVEFFLSSGLPPTPHFNVVDVKAATRWT